MQELPKIEPPPLVQQPTGSIEELGKSDQERDDLFAWLENLAAKQGASEGCSPNLKTAWNRNPIGSNKPKI